MREVIYWDDHCRVWVDAMMNDVTCRRDYANRARDWLVIQRGLSPQRFPTERSAIAHMVALIVDREYGRRG